MKVDKTALPKFIADYFNIDIDVVLSDTRKQSITEVRHLIMYILYQDYELEPTEICELVNRRSRSTVYNAIESIAYDLMSIKRLKIDLIIIRKYLNDPSLFRKKTTLIDNGDKGRGTRLKRMICQVSPEGLEIARYDTVVQGSFATDISVSTIYRSINSYKRLGGGFYWNKK